MLFQIQGQISSKYHILLNVNYVNKVRVGHRYYFEFFAFYLQLGTYVPSFQQRHFVCPHSSAAIFLRKYISFQPTISLPWLARVIFILDLSAIAAHASTAFF